jgi:hypothetical protein
MAVDAFIIFLLSAYGIMLLISLNLHPVIWFRKLSSMDKFTLFVALFTGIVALATLTQVWAFIQSERAYLLVTDANFLHGEPSAGREGFHLRLVMKNVGKHVAVITEFNTTPIFHVHAKKLPDTPQYMPQPITSVVPPIVPDTEITVMAAMM